MMTRDEGMTLVKSKIGNRNLVKHMLAVEVVMRHLARHFEEDEALWGLAGLLHDLDYDETADQPEKHGYMTEEWLAAYDLPEMLMDAIVSHPGHKARETRMAKALHAADPVTGLIVAAVLMFSGRKLRSMPAGFVLKRYKEKRFAAGANREQIASCETLGLTLEEFVCMALSAMQTIDSELGFA